MIGGDLGPGPRTRVRRLPDKARYDAEQIYSILDEAHMCHVGAIVDGQAVVLPTLHAREGNVVYLHGSQSNAVMRAVLASASACVTVTLYDGLRLARSGFESSIAYRSVVLFGAAREIVDEGEKARILDLFVDAVLPGRAESASDDRFGDSPHQGGRSVHRRSVGQGVGRSHRGLRRGP